MLERLLLVWLTLSSLLAYFWPSIFGVDVFDPFLASRPPVLWYLIAAVMFTIGGLLPRDEVQQVVARWPAVLGGTALQYTAMPALGYLFAQLCGLEGDFWVGVIVVGCVPGAMASNVVTLLARGNVSYSVSLTTCSTLLSPIIVPTVLWLALGRQVELPAGSVALELVLYVVAPVIAGYTLARLLPKFEPLVKRLGPVLANLAILWVIAVVVGLNRERLSHFGPGGAAPSTDLWLLAALLGVNFCGYLAGYSGGTLLRLPYPMRRALTLEVGMQNAGLGSTLALALFPDNPATAVPCALYTFGCMFTGTALARVWAEYDAHLARSTSNSAA